VSGYSVFHAPVIKLNSAFIFKDILDTKSPTSGGLRINRGGMPGKNRDIASAERGFNNEINGVFLKSEVHDFIHSPEYFKKVFDELSKATNATMAKNILKSIAQRLEAGTFI
jgi:hypothetical protein